MKHIFSMLGVFCMATAMACGIHQFKVPLNQRGFYNPAAICPYCEGSAYFATGAYAGIRSNDFGMFVTLGHDGNNAVHGAWDMTYSHASESSNSVTAFSGRYAWKQPIGSWMMAIGMRASWMNYTSIMMTGGAPEFTIAKATRNCYNFDAGLMVTNQKGIYAGLSVLNLAEPRLEMKFDFDGYTEYQSVQTQRAYVANAGGLVNLTGIFDMMLDASASVSGDYKCVRPSAMIRYKHKLALGSAVTVGNEGQPVFEIQGGYTTTPFKWLNTVAFTADGPVIETGIVVRFGVQRWRVTRLPVPCVSIPTPEPPRTEFFPAD